MLVKTKAAVEEKLSEEQLAILNESYPISPDESSGLKLPRLGMLSKDITEESGTGKSKKIEVVQAAGTFYTESDQGEVNEETGKAKWTKEYLDAATLDVIIVYHRRQLRRFDAGLKKFYSTPIFDDATQIVPLYLDGQIVKRGNQAELQALYPKLTQKGKPSSDLKEEAILYVIYKNELYQMNISQSSKWMFKTYKKSLNPSTVVTTIGSVEDTFGDNTFYKMTFASKGIIDVKMFETVVTQQNVVKDQVENDQKFYLASGGQEAAADKEFDALPGKKGDF